MIQALKVFLFKRYVDLRWDTPHPSVHLFDSIPYIQMPPQIQLPIPPSDSGKPGHRAHEINPSRSRLDQVHKWKDQLHLSRFAKRTTTPTPFQRGEEMGKKYGGKKDSLKIRKNTFCCRKKKRVLFNAMSISFHFQLYHDDPTIFWTPVQNSRPFWWFRSKGKNTFIEFKFIVLYTPQSSKCGWFRWFTQYQSAQKKSPNKRKGPPPYSGKKKQHSFPGIPPSFPS